MLDELTYDFMHALIGTSAFADAGAGHRVELRIIDVAKVMESEAAKLKRTPFSIFFLGPSSFPLPQQTYPIYHDEFGESLPIFVVPVGQRAEGYVYEAVFT